MHQIGQHLWQYSCEIVLQRAAKGLATTAKTGTRATQIEKAAKSNTKATGRKTSMSIPNIICLHLGSYLRRASGKRYPWCMPITPSCPQW